MVTPPLYQDSLFQCLDTLSMKEFFLIPDWNLPWYNLMGNQVSDGPNSVENVFGNTPCIEHPPWPAEIFPFFI